MDGGTILLAVMIALTLLYVIRLGVTLHRTQDEIIQLQKLNEAARRLESILENLPEAVLLVDRDGRRFSAAPQADRLELGGLAERIPADALEEVLASLQTAIDLNARQEARYGRGSRAYAVEIIPVEHESLPQRAAVVSIRDVTELDQSITRMRSLAARNEAILRSAMDGFFVVGEDYRFIEVNDSFCRMTGYSREELLKLSISDLEVDDPDPGLTTPPYARTGLHQFPTSYRHCDGHVIYLEISVNVVRDGSRRILVGFARDETERRRAEEQLARLTRNMKLILESAGEGIFGIDLDGCATFVNAAAGRLLGADPAALIRGEMHRVLYGDGKTAGRCTIPQCAVCTALYKSGTHQAVHGRFVHADRGPFDVEFSSTPIYENGRVTGAVVVFSDVTERIQSEARRRELERQVQQAQRLESLGVLAGGIAHDFNNILVGIMGNACLIRDALPPESPISPRVARIVSASERASKIIHQIFAYTGHAAHELSDFQINDLVDEMTDLMRAGVPACIDLQITNAQELPAVRGDAGQIQQVLTNLLVNAVEAIGDQSGRIEVTTRDVRLSAEDVQAQLAGQEMQPGRYVRIDVADNGPGMPPDKLQRIFEPFFSDKGKGRGLGLTALHGVVRAHGGGVRAESTVGVGTRFTIYLPAASGAPASRPSDAEAQALDRPMRVLVIDDEADIRDVLVEALESRGMQVFTADDGRAGIEMFESRHDEIDVVLLDMTMPGMTGGAVLTRLEEIDPDLRVIIASGYSEENIRQKIGRGGAVAVIQKPFTIDALVRKLHAVVAASGGSGAGGRSPRQSV